MNGTQEREGAVNQKQHKHLFAMCQCGKVKFEAVGQLILTGSCYCTSCQEPDVSLSSWLLRRLCSIPTVEQA
jgi:hypothetical protein